MSIFESRHDNALLGSSWLTKDTNDGKWLFKYAWHPDREGYVFVATNLELVLFESLTAPSIPSRLASLGSTKNRDSSSQKAEEDVLAQVARTLKRLEGVLHPGKGWDGSSIEIKEHSFYDRVIRLTTGGREDFEWIFNTAELRGPMPLSFISRHLVGPLASMAVGHGESLSALDGISAILTDHNLSNTFSEVASSASALPARRPVRPTSESDGNKSEGNDESMSENPLPATQRSPPAEIKSLSPVREERVTEDVDEEEEDQVGEEEEYRSSPLNTPEQASPTVAPSPTQVDRSTTLSPVKRADRSPKRNAPLASISPAKPTPSAPSQLSQKSKREREQEEEEEMEKRREEMKRRMHAGGGGRLGKRRAGR